METLTFINITMMRKDRESLKNMEFNSLRFEDIEAKKNMKNILRIIEGWITKNTRTTGSSLESSI
jgi:hypothetical protein